MYAGRNADEGESLSLTTGTRAPGFSGQHAIEAWESEGGGTAGTGVVDERDLAPTALADNVGWRASNNVGWLANHPLRGRRKEPDAMAIALPLADEGEDDRILRCLGGAVITRWNTIPTKLQKELFDHASSMGELLQTEVLKGQIARFLHKHKDDAS